MNGSRDQTITSGIAHNISFGEEKVDILKSERSMYEDLRVLSIRSGSSAVGRTLPKRLHRVRSCRWNNMLSFCSEKPV
jgi:hypothetical protein